MKWKRKITARNHAVLPKNCENDEQNNKIGYANSRGRAVLLSRNSKETALFLLDPEPYCDRY
jgi:hypothetical protein